MADHDNLDIDALIEEVLLSDSMVPAPPTLQRRVEERVRIAAMRAHERARFRYSMLTLTGAFVGALAAAGLLVSFTNLDVVISHGVSGYKGQLDYYTGAMRLSAMDYRGTYSLVLSLIGAGSTVALGLIPLGKYLRSSRTH